MDAPLGSSKDEPESSGAGQAKLTSESLSEPEARHKNLRLRVVEGDTRGIVDGSVGQHVQALFRFIAINLSSQEKVSLSSMVKPAEFSESLENESPGDSV